MRTEYLQKMVNMMPYDAVLICPGEEMRFFAGFTVMLCERFQGLFVKKDGSCFYLCNILYEGEIRDGFHDEIPVYIWHDNDGMPKVYSILKEQGLWGKTIGVGATAQAFNVLDIAQNCGINMVNGKAFFESVREKKNHEELEAMRATAAIADSAFEEACAMIRPGITEGDIRKVMFDCMTRQGGKVSDVLVASGPNSAFPHYLGTSRVIEEGDCIILDWGCVYHEMTSDESRTVFVGSITDEQREVYDLVNRSQAAAQDEVYEGAFIPDIDKKSREVLDEKGLAYTLVNRVGHGIGYYVHEGPYINQLNERRLERGMCFSVEPGVYLPGKWGMRVENIVCINENGEREILNKTDRSLRVIDWYKK